MNEQGNDSVGLNSALQSALSAPSIHQQPFQPQLLQAHQMVNPQGLGGNHPLRNIAPRANAPGAGIYIDEGGLGGGPIALVPVSGNIRQIQMPVQFIGARSIPYVTDGNQVGFMSANQPLIQIVQPQRMVNPAIMNRQQQMAQQTQRITQMVPRPAAVAQQPAQVQPAGNPEVVTISDTPSPINVDSSITAGGDETEDGAEGDETDMPVLDRQDPRNMDSQESADSEGSDDFAHASREAFIKEAENFNNRNNADKPIYHYTNGGALIMESREPFATRPEQYRRVPRRRMVEIENEDVKPDISSTKKIRVVNEGEEGIEIKMEIEEQSERGPRRRGRPAGRGRSRRSDQSEQDERQERTSERRRRRKREEISPTPQNKQPKAAGKAESGEKGKRKRRTEADRLVDMDFGPLAGERILSGHRRRSQPASREEQRPQRSRNEFREDASSEEGESTDDYNSYYRENYETRRRRTFDVTKDAEEEEFDEEEDDETRGHSEERRRKRGMGIGDLREDCLHCGESILRRRWHRSQFCTIKCRDRHQNIMEEASQLQQAGILHNRPESSKMSIEVVGQEQISIPTEAAKREYPNTEGEGANQRPAPSSSRLRRSSAHYIVESLPGCDESDIKPDIKPDLEALGYIERQSTNQPAKPAFVKAKTIEAAKPGTSRVEVVKPPKTPSNVHQTSPPKTVEIRNPDQPPQSSKEETPSSISRTSSTKDLTVLGNPEAWDLKTTCENVDEGMRKFCIDNGLDAFILANGGDSLEHLRKNILKMPDGQKVSLGPWRKLTSTIRDYMKPYLGQRSLVSEHGLSQASTNKGLYQWIEKITDKDVAEAMQRHHMHIMALQYCNMDELADHLGIKIGRALKIYVAVTKSMEQKTWPIDCWPSKSAPKVPEFDESWDYKATEYTSWLISFLDQESKNILYKKQIDINLLFYLSVDDLIKRLGLRLGVAKTIEAVVKMMKVAGKEPTKKLDEVADYKPVDFFTPGGRKFFQKLLQFELGQEDFDILAANHLANPCLLWFTTEQILSWTSLDNLSFGLLKKLSLKVDAFRGREILPEIPKIPAPAAPIETLTTEDVANWFEKILTLCDEEIFNQFKKCCFDGRTLTFAENVKPFFNPMAMALIIKHLKEVDFSHIKFNKEIDENFLTLEGDDLDKWLKENMQGYTPDNFKGLGMKGRYFGYLTLPELESRLPIALALKMKAFWKEAQVSRETGVYIPAGAPANWGVDDFYKWVRSLTSEEEVEKLKSESVEASNFTTLSFDDFKEIGIKFGPFKALYVLYQKLSSERAV